jgi:hypothetical protein
MKRLCHDCWLSKITREEKAFKEYLSLSTDRITLQRLLECIPVALQDSYFKAVDWKDDLASVGGQPRLYKVYYKTDIERIIEKYNAIRPAPFRENPEWTQPERDTRFREYQTAVAEARLKQDEFVETMKARNDEFMAWVKSVERAQKRSTTQTRADHDVNRNARRALFTRRAKEDLPHIPMTFIQQRSDAYKRATRIFRDPGTERGWNTMKPKIEKEWEEYLKKGPEAQKDAPVENENDGLDVSEEDEFNEGVDMLAHFDSGNSHLQHDSFNADPTNSFGSGNDFAYDAASQAQPSEYQAPLGYTCFFDEHAPAARSSHLPTFGQQHSHGGSSNMYGASQTSVSNSSSNMYGLPSQNSASTRVTINSLLGPSQN